MAKNISKVYLLNVPLEDDMRNTLYFADASAQQSYFNSVIGKTYTNVSYQSESRTFRCPDQLDTVRQYNYIMWQNTAYTNKWFYAFIKEMNYVSDGFTDVVFEVDPLQTYMFDITVKPSFIDREHTNNDTFGNNTIPENLQTGEYVRSTTGTQYSYDNFYLCFQVTELISNMAVGGWSTSRLYNGIYNGLYCVFVDSYTVADNLVAAYDDAGKSDSIISCFYVPKNICTVITHYNVVLHGVNCTIYIPNASNSATVLTSLSVNKPATIDGYSPKNNKLFTGEYCFMLASNNNGSEATYRFEDWRSSNGTSLTTATFSVDGVLSQGCSIRMFPNGSYKAPVGATDYRTLSANAKYGLTAGKLPLCSWNSDYYTNWLTQNAVNIATSGMSTAGNFLGNLFTGNVVGAFGSLYDGITSNVKKSYEASIVPDQAKGNTNSGDLNFSEDIHLTITTMTVRAEYAKIIDDYFQMFGYKTSRVKTPNVAHRQNWWYIKTIGANIVGNVPNEEMNKIKEAYNNGLTYWRTASNFLNYSVSNGIV